MSTIQPRMPQKKAKNLVPLTWKFPWKSCSTIYGSFENEALKNEDRSTKHPNLENEAPKTRKRRPLDRKRSTLSPKQRPRNLENEAPKTRNHCRFNKGNFTAYMTQSESGGGSGCVRTSKGPQNPSQGFITNCFTERFFIGYPVLILLLVSLYLIHLTLICIFSVHIHVYVDFKTVRQQILAYSSTREQ